VRTMFRAYYDNMNFEATWSYSGDPNLDTQTVPSTTYGAEANVMLQSGQHHILAGLELQKHFTSQTEFYPSEPTYSFNSYSFYNAAVYLQDDFPVSELWSLDVGLRYEFHENVGGILVGKGAIAYHPKLGTVFRFQYGTGFNNPLLHDYFYLSSDLNLRNDAIVKLSRERVSTFEFVWERSSNRIQSSLAFYYSIFDRFITITSQDYYDNLSGLRSYGAEYELRYSSAPQLTGYANATLQRTIDSETKRQIPNAPEYSIKAGSVFRPTETGNLSMSVEMQMYGQMDFREIRAGVHFDQRAHAVANAHVRYDITESTALSLGIGNLFNTAYRFAPSKGDGHPIYGNGRTYFLRGEVKL
jgi:outer membrane receptor protein involved in Fe transport